MFHYHDFLPCKMSIQFVYVLLGDDEQKVGADGISI